MGRVIPPRRMSKTLRSPAHLELLTLLREARESADLTQTQLAQIIGRPQSFVAKIEGGERRMDVVEFIMVMKALGVDPTEAVRKIAVKVPPPSLKVKSKAKQGSV